MCERNPRSTVAVIGGGFSGLLTAIHLLERDPSVTVRLVEKAPQFARGRAYDALRPDHLLNVRAANMSAFPDRPDHFRSWLAEHDGCVTGDAFVSRRRYGDYLQDLLRQAICGPGAPARLLLEQDEATSIRPTGHGFEVRLAVGRRFDVDAVVLAVGFAAPAQPPFALADVLSQPTYVGDPWRGDLQDLPGGDILLLGSGLTTVDVVLSLDRPDRSLTILSRHGLLPRTHASAPPVPPPDGPLDTPHRASRTLRLHARTHGWRSAVDSIRPLTPAIWRSWSLRDRARFLRHLRPWWDVHRHRMAPQVALRLAEPLWGERLVVMSGRLLRLRSHDSGFEAAIRMRGDRHPTRRLFRAVVNCTGPTSDLRALPVLSELLEKGLIRPDPLGLGVDVDQDGRLLGRAECPTRGLYAVGPLTRGAFWEAVAAPDLRNRTSDVANAVLTDLVRASAA